MKPNILQVMKTKKLMMKLAMTTLVCTIGMFGIPGVISQISICALKPSEQSTHAAASELISKNQESQVDGDSDCGEDVFESESEGDTDDADLDEILSGVGIIVGEEKYFLNPIFDNVDAKEMVCKISECDDEKLPEVAVILDEDTYNIEPRFKETDLYVENIFVKNSKVGWDFFNNFFDYIQAIDDIDSLKRFFDIHDEFVKAYIRINEVCNECQRYVTAIKKSQARNKAKKKKICAIPDDRETCNMEDFYLGARITSIVDAFALAAKEVINENAICKREIWLTCNKLRNIAREHPEILNVTKVNSAIAKIIELKSKARKSKETQSLLNLLLDGYECKEKPKKIEVVSSFDLGEEFNLLDDLNQAYIKVYNVFLEVRKLIDERRYDEAQAKLNEARVRNKEFECIYQQCVTLVGMVRYRDLAKRFDKIYFGLRKEIMFDGNIKNKIRKSMESIQTIRDIHKDELFAEIDKLLSWLNEIYPLGTTYLTELTFNDIDTAIQTLEKLKLDIIAEREREIMEEKRKAQEELKKQEECAEKIAAEWRRKKEQGAKWVEAQHKKKREEELKNIANADECRRRALRNRDILSHPPIYEVVYINEKQRRDAEKFLLCNRQYEKDWKAWYDLTCRGWFTTNMLPKSNCTFYKDNTGGVHPYNGNIYEAQVRTDGEQQGLRVVFYKDKNSDKVVIIYVGAPFGEQHGNKMPTIDIYTVTFPLVMREYTTMNPIGESAAAVVSDAMKDTSPQKPEGSKKKGSRPSKHEKRKKSK